MDSVSILKLSTIIALSLGTSRHHQKSMLRTNVPIQN